MKKKLSLKNLHVSSFVTEAQKETKGGIPVSVYLCSEWDVCTTQDIECGTDDITCKYTKNWTACATYDLKCEI